MGGGHKQAQGCTEDRTPRGYQKDEEGGIPAKRMENREERLWETGRKNRAKAKDWEELNEFEKLKGNSCSQKSQGKGGILRDLLVFKGEQKRSRPPWTPGWKSGLHWNIYKRQRPCDKSETWVWISVATTDQVYGSGDVPLPFGASRYSSVK